MIHKFRQFFNNCCKSCRRAADEQRSDSHRVSVSWLDLVNQGQVVPLSLIC